MFKKVLSGILIVGLLIGLTVFPVSAAISNPVSITGWGLSFYQTPDNTSGLTPGATGVQIITDPAMVPSGKGALHVFCEKNLDYLNAQAVQNISALESGKRYRLTGKFWTQSTSWRFRLLFGNTSFVEPLSNITNGVTGQWVDVDYIFTFSYSSKDFKIQANGGGSVYADDLSIKEVIYDTDGETIVGYGPELLQNGDFEADFVQPDEADFVNVASRNGANYIAVKTGYPNTAIYAVSQDGSQTPLSLAVVLENANYNLKVYAHEGLTNGTIYK